MSFKTKQNLRLNVWKWNELSVVVVSFLWVLITRIIDKNHNFLLNLVELFSRFSVLLLFWRQWTEVRVWFWRDWRSSGLRLFVLIKMAAVLWDEEWAQAVIRTQAEDTKKTRRKQAPKPGCKPHQEPVNRPGPVAQVSPVLLCRVPSASSTVIDECLIETSMNWSESIKSV